MSEGIFFNENEDDVKNCKKKKKKGSNTAKKRWHILARALTGSSEFIGSDNDNEEDESNECEDARLISIRRFTSFGLLKIIRLENTGIADPDANWYEYSTQLGNDFYEVLVRRIDKCFTANELIGFNNTGNVCVWPSEECLGYYLLRNPCICRNRKVLELGGGMSCLAGVLAAKYCEPTAVTLTDGNVTSVDNARCIVARNGLADWVHCGVVQWAKAAQVLRKRQENGNCLKSRTSSIYEEELYEDSERLYDVILCADCLFFDDTRLDLVETIYGWLADDGIALVIAPRRGMTFQKFAEAAIKRGIVTRQIECYDNFVWSKHLELVQNNQDYCPDLHYPILLELTKQNPLPG